MLIGILTARNASDLSLDADCCQEPALTGRFRASGTEMFYFWTGSTRSEGEKRIATRAQENQVQRFVPGIAFTSYPSPLAHTPCRSPTESGVYWGKLV
jgi:hypothetical protein